MEQTACRVKFSADTIAFELEGPRDLVEQGFEWVKENFPFDRAQVQTSEVSAARRLEEPEKQRRRPPPPPPSAQVPTLRDFYQQKNPKNEMERVAVLAYYAREHRNRPEVSDKELQPMFNEAGGKIPNDTMVAFRNATRKGYGYMESVPGKKKYYRVTNAGVNLVRLDLPRGPQKSGDDS